MVVPKTTETRCRDGSAGNNSYTKSTQAASSLHLFCFTILFPVHSITHRIIGHMYRKDIGMGLLVYSSVACPLPSLHLVCVVWHYSGSSSVELLEVLYPVTFIQYITRMEPPIVYKK